MWGQDVVFVDNDRRMYLSYLKESAALYGLEVSAFCLMTNHIHLVATPSSKTPSSAPGLAAFPRAAKIPSNAPARKIGRKGRNEE